ncbi:Protein-L-isoaspartate(D-aspartate) O-methyltransferase [Methylocella silvestris BL2]|uniref:Protein-L-isoaspartate O-methyltransferase n=1 Tax=Methylocella silvestris (strain DSM 15510 / CIP 108128 / LMG 27833 / NCIMB 13906 / BL2) TaxID=395965 RepID=B8ERC3_METSB|nr:protein-L-isoaspartate(D-aspartate) O-methyltransferase [Methylocella silvestris]ACK50307.1 Protein-L-isoaspartate(D-aspartate) O-methyltransferase [Methylocella silvestris BL2]
MRQIDGAPPDPIAAAGFPALRPQSKAAFLLEMRARGIQDVNLLRALETVPRETFVPHRYRDLARRNLALPLRCGQTLPEPWLCARMIEALSLSPRCVVLEIGAGSGYAAALIARIASRIVSFERFQTLAVEAGARLEQLGVQNARVIWGDGLAGAAAFGPFDKIIVQGALAEPPDALLGVLADGGVLVMARPDRGEPRRQHIVRVTRNGGGGFDVAPVCPCRMQPILAGKSRAL